MAEQTSALRWGSGCWLRPRSLSWSTACAPDGELPTIVDFRGFETRIRPFRHPEGPFSWQIAIPGAFRGGPKSIFQKVALV